MNLSIGHFVPTATENSRIITPHVRILFFCVIDWHYDEQPGFTGRNMRDTVAREPVRSARKPEAA